MLRGDTLWCRTFGDADIDGPSAVVQSDDGGFLVCGWLGDLPGNGNGRELHLVRTDANGDTLWTRCFGGIYGDVADAIAKQRMVPTSSPEPHRALAPDRTTSTC
ncbi:MAG: hypothetical protein IPL77_09445 [Flavobacteriales bacterium]|nr:hypothetical protein [Flavobacteriales bacterium]